MKLKQNTLSRFFFQIDVNGDEWLDESEISRALLVANIKLPNYQVRDLLIDLKSKGKVQSDGRISKQVFKEVRSRAQKGRSILL